MPYYLVEIPMIVQQHRVIQARNVDQARKILSALYGDGDRLDDITAITVARAHIDHVFINKDDALNAMHAENERSVVAIMVKRAECYETEIEEGCDAHAE